MDVLKDKTYENYSYTSRYSTVPYYQNFQNRQLGYSVLSKLQQYKQEFQFRQKTKL